MRHGINVLVVISLNGGWTADPDGTKPGRDLGYTRYDKMAEALGCYAEYVEQPDEIKGALERAQEQVNEGKVAVVNGGFTLEGDVPVSYTHLTLPTNREV